MDAMRLTYDQAERAYRDGRLARDEWLRFCCAWRNRTVRFSTLASEHDACGTGPCRILREVTHVSERCESVGC